MADATATARTEIRRLLRAPEPEVLAPLLQRAALDSDSRARVEERALVMLAELREAQGRGWVNQFLQEYRLNTQEGVALLSLAEAFLRVPDPETADSLIADKLGEGDWRSHKGKANSTLVNTATWGLVIGRALTSDSEHASALRKLIARTGEPFVRTGVGAAMRMMGEIFVMGRNIDEAIARMKKRENRGFTASFDMLGEAARTFPDAEHYYQSYEDAIRAVGKAAEAGHSISVKLSALHPRYEVAQYERCVPDLIGKVEALAALAAGFGIPFTIDAEETERLEMSLDIIEAVAGLPALKGWDGLGMAIQAYGKRARPTIAWADAIGAKTGRRIAARLVKGAYWDTEIKRTQEQGLSDYPLFTRKAATDVSYLACARDMLEARNIRPAFATHNALTVATLLEWAGDSRDFEFQRLHGMGEGLYESLVREQGYHTRIYAPVGGHRDLLAYLVRRLLENGANSSFVHQLADETLTDEDLLADPVAKISAVGGTRHPSIPLPEDLFAPERKNSEGLDLNDRPELARIAKAVAPLLDFAPMTADPADMLVSRALGGFEDWSRRSIDERAACLERLADLLEEDRDMLMRIAVREAGKTIPDALAEVREAVDFCRYYAAQARARLRPLALPGPTGERNVLRMEGRGVFVCIAPWNFPLAIFLGQVSAALAAGNAVVAKPASQTPEIAAYAVGLAHAAGVPEDALILAAGRRDLGQKLMEDVRIAGVAFTGSTATAKTIARTLVADDHRDIIPLIAETGGINAMIVDSTALPEQVVQDVITSAFRSAGQRCSALRLLVLQEDVAERTLAMLTGAMDSLIVGDPALPETDVGPVIDADAKAMLDAHIARLRVKGRVLGAVPLPELARHGTYVTPIAVEIGRADLPEREVFGPVLHVVRYRATDLERVLDVVAGTGYGLTLGIHSRIERFAERVRARLRVGNTYVNRNMIGAVVGVQPFGGEGLSGTGPKAGGPHYLPRFAVERTLTVNTAAAGGNAALLAQAD